MKNNILTTSTATTQSDLSFAVAIINEKYDTNDMSLEDIAQIIRIEFGMDISSNDIVDYYQLDIDLEDKRINYKMNV